MSGNFSWLVVVYMWWLANYSVRGIRVTYPEKTSNEASSKHVWYIRSIEIQAIWTTGVDYYSHTVQYVAHCSEVDDTQESCLYEVVKEVCTPCLYMISCFQLTSTSTKTIKFCPTLYSQLDTKIEENEKADSCWKSKPEWLPGVRLRHSVPPVQYI